MHTSGRTITRKHGSAMTSRTDKPRPKKPIQRQKMAVVVADSIADDIFTRGLVPGVVLATESQMLDQFGVGRATLREGLRLLEAEGLISVRAGPNGGAVVQRPSEDRLARLLSILLAVAGTTLQDVIEARQVLEPALASLAAQHADADDLAQLDVAVARLQANEGGGGFLALSGDFHSVVARASRNRALSSFWFAIEKIVDGQQAGVHYTPESMQGAIRAHKRIGEAIRRHDPAAAAEAMRRHMAGHLLYLQETHPAVLRSEVRLVDMNS